MIFLCLFPRKLRNLLDNLWPRGILRAVNESKGYAEKETVMKMMTKAILDKIPALYAQDGKGEEATAFVKFFQGPYTGFFTEFDPVEKLLFGKVYIHGNSCDPEWGYTSLDELEQNCVERDRYFKPTMIKDCDFAGYSG